MIEDKLTSDERIRLECVAQANAQMTLQTADQIIEKAVKLEAYIKNGKTNSRFGLSF